VPLADVEIQTMIAVLGACSLRPGVARLAGWTAASEARPGAMDAQAHDLQDSEA
jgi:hypothetical protein